MVNIHLFGTVIDSTLLFQIVMAVFAAIGLVLAYLNYCKKPTTTPKISPKKLAERITKESVLSIAKGEEKESENDPMLPIIDIIRKSMMEYDDKRMIDGLRAIEGRTSHIFKETETFEEDEEEKVSNHIFSSLSKIAELAIEHKHSHEAYWIVQSLGELGKRTIILKRQAATGRIFYYLGLLGKEAVENGLYNVYRGASDSLYLRGMEAAGKEFESPILWAVSSLEGIGKAKNPQGFKVKSEVQDKLNGIEKVANGKNMDAVKLRIGMIKKDLEN